MLLAIDEAIEGGYVRYYIQHGVEIVLLSAKRGVGTHVPVE
jgi:hypothetical protein